MSPAPNRNRMVMAKGQEVFRGSAKKRYYFHNILKAIKTMSNKSIMENTSTGIKL